MNKEELDPESLPPIDVEAELEKLPDEFGEMNGMIFSPTCFWLYSLLSLTTTTPT